MNNGYIALISVIVISMLLLTVTFALSFSSFFTRFDTLDLESKTASADLAEACASNAMLKLARDPSYQPALGGDTIAIGTENCRIVSVIPSGITRQIKTQGQRQQAVTNLNVSATLTPVDLIVNTWQETAN